MWLSTAERWKIADNDLYDVKILIVCSKKKLRKKENGVIIVDISFRLTIFTFIVFLYHQLTGKMHKSYFKNLEKQEKKADF